MGVAVPGIEMRHDGGEVMAQGLQAGIGFVGAECAALLVHAEGVEIGQGAAEPVEHLDIERGGVTQGFRHGASPVWA